MIHVILKIVFIIITITILTLISVNIYKIYKSNYYAVFNKNFCLNNKDKCKENIKSVQFLNTIPTEYNLEFAKFNANLLLKLYKHNIDDIPQLVHKISRNGIIFAVIYKDNSNIYINFRGSATFQDFKNDIMIKEIILPKKTNTTLFSQRNIIINKSKQLQAINHNSNSKTVNPKVHTGYFNMYTDVKKDILDNINEPFDNIIISGHSLGGTISILCGLDLASQFFPKNVIVYTFASPKVGDENFRDIVEKQTNLYIYRIVNVNDIIPLSPPAVVPNISNYTEPYFYSHVGVPKYFDLQRYSMYENHSLITYNYYLTEEARL